MSTLICHVCGKQVDPEGPAVGESHNWEQQGDWWSRWVPWVADIHGGIPDRLVHPACFVSEQDLASLLSLIVDSERKRR